MSDNLLSASRVITDKVAENISRVEELAYEIRVREVMTSQVITMHPNDTMQTVLETFRQARISGAPVLEEGNLIGLVSIEDLIRCLLNQDLAAPVHQYMTPDPVVVKGR